MKFNHLYFFLIVLAVIISIKDNNYIFIEAKEINNNDSSNNNNKQDKNLNNILIYNNYYYNSSSNIKIWVFFNNKNIINYSKLDSSSDSNSNQVKNIFIDQSSGRELSENEIIAISGISNESLERRRIRSSSKDDIIDGTDLPISNEFIDEILNCNIIENSTITLNHKSNWLNSISISIKLNNSNNLKLILECITGKAYVNSIDIVKKSIKRPIKREYKNLNSIIAQDYENENRKLDTNLGSSGSGTSNSNDEFYGESIKPLRQLKVDKLHKLGYHGENITILVIDDDFYLKHPAFKSMNVIGEKEFFNSNGVNNSNNENLRNRGLKDNGENFHGTSVLSVLGGYEQGKLVGPAYKSKYLLGKIKVSEEEDSMFEEDQFVASIEWGEQNGAQIISSSLSFSLTLNYSYFRLDGKQSYTTKAANIAIEKGIIFVNAMGNDDFSLFGGPNDGEFVIAVGAVDEYGGIASFSGLGPTADSRPKPETQAMGININVADVLSNTKYSQFSGTSFSTPLIAGTLALLLQAHPNWNPKQMYQAVVNSCIWSPNPHYLLGYGLLDAEKAFNYKPTMSNHCTQNQQCLNKGLCCNGKCICPLAFYGQFCELKKIECGYRCKYDFPNSTQCQKNIQGNSYLCVSINEKNQQILEINQNPLFPPISNCSNSNDGSYEEFKVTKPPLIIMTFDNTHNTNNNNSNNSFKDVDFFNIILIIIFINLII